MKKQFLFLVLLGLICSIGSVWAADHCTKTISADGKTCTWDFYTDRSKYTAETIVAKGGNDFENGLYIIAGTKAASSLNSSGYLSMRGENDNAFMYIPVPSDAVGTITFTYGGSNSGRYTKLQNSSGDVDGQSVSPNGSGSSNSITLANANVTTETITNADGNTWAKLKITGGEIKYRSISVTLTTGSFSSAPSISADDVNIVASATGGSIIYSINNPVGGGSVTAAKKGSEEWLTAVGTEKSSPISFTTQPNTGAARSATVTLTYTYGAPASTVTKDVTITQAAPTLFTVTYNANMGSCETSSATQASYDASITLPTPTWSGYTFDGWYYNGTKIGNAGASYVPTANITLYAKWTDNIEGKIFSYVDGNYGDKFMAFDGSDWVTADATGKSKTFTDATTGAQFVITDGAWDKKNNTISALAKFKAGSTTMKVVIPTGYKATVKIWYNSYNTNKYLKIDNEEQTKPTTILADGQTNADVEASLVGITVSDKSGEVVFTTSGNSDNIYIARVAAVVTAVSGTVSTIGWSSYASKYPLDMSSLTFSEGTGAAYYASTKDIANSIITLSPISTSIPAGEGILIKGTAGETFTINTAASGSLSGNLLVGVLADNTSVSSPYVLAGVEEDGETPYFQQYNGSTMNANKAYLPSDILSGAAGRIRFVVEEENNATSITSIEDTDETVKFIQNGQLFIMRNGVVYDAMGRIIR